MYCSNCGKKLEEGALFCHNCGVRIEPVEQLPVDRRAETKQPEGAPIIKRRGGIVSRVCAIVAVVSFLLLPQISCGGIAVSGIDLVNLSLESAQYYPSGAEAGSSTFILFLAIVIVGSAIVGVVLNTVVAHRVSGIVGLVSSLIILIQAKTEGEFGAFISIEFGGFLTCLSFLGVIIGDGVESFFKKKTV